MRKRQRPGQITPLPLTARYRRVMGKCPYCKVWHAGGKVPRIVQRWRAGGYIHYRLKCEKCRRTWFWPRQPPLKLSDLFARFAPPERERPRRRRLRLNPWECKPAEIDSPAMRSHFDYLLRRGRDYYVNRGYTYSFDAKVVVETEEPVYPFRPTEVRRLSRGSREFPCQDKVKWASRSGRFVTWLKPNELQHALAHGHLVEFHEAIIRANHPKASTNWQRARREALRRYGHKCSECGTSEGQMHVDHVRPWAKFPELRYDLENLRMLCSSCHAAKHGRLI